LNDEWVFLGNDNYNDASGPVGNNISKASATAHAGGGSATYDGTAKTPSACVVNGPGYLGDLTCSNDPASIGPQASSYVVKAVMHGTGLSNFDVTKVDGTYTIEKASVTAHAGGGTATYDGTAKTPSACVVDGPGYLGDLTCSNDPSSVGPQANSYVVRATVNGTGLSNFDITKVDGTYTIEKASVTAHAGGGTATYDGTAKDAIGMCGQWSRLFR
jgi:hypothetical protein